MSFEQQITFAAQFPLSRMKTLQTQWERYKKSAFVLDDHNLFAESFSMLLEGAGIFNSVCFYSNPEALLDHISQQRNPSATPYFFLDYYLKDQTVISTLNKIKQIIKEAKIIIISGDPTPDIIARLLDYNVDGIIPKAASMQEVVDCMKALRIGEHYYAPEVREVIEELGNRQNQLTLREIEILEHFSKGLTVDETARLMFLSRHTIAAHRRKMFKKTGSNNIAELLNFARKQVLI